MNIVIIDKYNSSKISGTIIFTKRLVEYLQTRGHIVHVIRFTNEKRLPNSIIPIPFHIAEQRSYIIIPSEKTPWLVRHHLKKLHPDIVYAYCGVSPFDFILPSICHALHIPLAVVWHQDFNYSANAIQLMFKALFWAYVPVCESSDLLHVFSQKLKQFYVRRGISSKKILVLPNGVNPDNFSPGISAYKTKHHIKKGILFMGRLTMQKNPEVLLQSFLKIDPPLSTKLIVMGRGDLGAKLKKKYSDPRILFTGLVSNEKKKIDIMRACSIFVQPSLNEGMSLALLESMATGLACITSDAGNNRELMKNSGVIIPLGEMAKNLPRILDSYIRDIKGVREKGMKARQTILKNHVESRQYDTLISSFQNTIQTYRLAN